MYSGSSGSIVLRLRAVVLSSTVSTSVSDQDLGHHGGGGRGMGGLAINGDPPFFKLSDGVGDLVVIFRLMGRV